MKDVSAEESLSSSCPPSVRIHEDIGFASINLPPPRWSRSSRLVSILTVASGLAGFAIPFALTIGLQLSTGLPVILTMLLVVIDLVIMISALSAAGRLRRWRRARLPGVCVMLTPGFIEVTFKRGTHRVYLSALQAGDDGALDSWRGLQHPIRSLLTSQDEPVVDWLSGTIRAWARAHHHQQGSRDDVPLGIETLGQPARRPMSSPERPVPHTG